ncbi:hypothetical protein DLM46_13010 [Paraburkholderia lacunae]|uniref:Uncharacterized protein n=1 Tax=Paraburkholderia lacunae TaxID=2211104 RepID=A0A370NA82_9BURK|nr:hypothetical protein DLM46_13010 [Paraburkholderia lacunae]
MRSVIVLPSHNDAQGAVHLLTDSDALASAEKLPTARCVDLAHWSTLQRASNVQRASKTRMSQSMPLSRVHQRAAIGCRNLREWQTCSLHGGRDRSLLPKIGSAPVALFRNRRYVSLVHREPLRVALPKDW